MNDSANPYTPPDAVSESQPAYTWKDNAVFFGSWTLLACAAWAGRLVLLPTYQQLAVPLPGITLLVVHTAFPLLLLLIAITLTACVMYASDAARRRMRFYLLGVFAALTLIAAYGLLVPLVSVLEPLP